MNLSFTHKPLVKLVSFMKKKMKTKCVLRPEDFLLSPNVKNTSTFDKLFLFINSIPCSSVSNKTSLNVLLTIKMLMIKNLRTITDKKSDSGSTRFAKGKLKSAKVVYL